MGKAFGSRWGGWGGWGGKKMAIVLRKSLFVQRESFARKLQTASELCRLFQWTRE